MNNQLQKYARDTLKDGLSKCTDAQRHLFKLLYGDKDTKIHINEVVDQIPEDRLDWAMRQVQRTLRKK